MVIGSRRRLASIACWRVKPADDEDDDVETGAPLLEYPEVLEPTLALVKELVALVALDEVV